MLRLVDCIADYLPCLMHVLALSVWLEVLGSEYELHKCHFYYGFAASECVVSRQLFERGHIGRAETIM